MKRKEIKEQRAINREQRSWSKIRKSCYFLFTLCYLLFVFACSVDIPRSEKEPLPLGYGSFALQLPANAARTILPVAPGLGDFVVFELDFEATVDGEDRNVKFLETALDDKKTPSYILVAGTYDITLNAYLDGDTDAPANLAASGTITDIKIEPGDTVAKDITLKMLLTGTVKGKFIWDIDVPSDVTGATMTITGGGINPIEIDLSTDNNKSEDLNPGIYNVAIELVRDTFVNDIDNLGKRERAVWYEILYIYSSLDSDFTMEFDDKFFHNTHYNVTFHFYNPHYISNDNLTASYVQSVPHAGKLNSANDNLERDGFEFKGWYRDLTYSSTDYSDPDTTCTPIGTAWDFTNNVVLENMTLHAAWTPNKIGINIKADFSELGEKAPVISVDDGTPIFDSNGVQTDLTLSRSGNPDKIDVTISEDYDAGSLNWRIRRVDTGNANDYVTGTTSPIPLDATDTQYNALGWHTVEVSVEVDGLKYQTSFRFNIVK